MSSYNTHYTAYNMVRIVGVLKMPEKNQLCREAIVSDEFLDLIVEYNGDLEIVREQYKTNCIQIINFKYGVVHIPRVKVPPLSIVEYGYRVIPKCYGLMDRSSMQESGITRIQNQPVLALRGQNVLVGFIDTGIDYTNSIFRKADGTTRILSIWDQEIQTGNPPLGFLYGSEYTETDINMALQEKDPYTVVPSRDTEGHGTFLAGIAAGGEDIENDFIGAAPDSDLVVVKLKDAKPYLKAFTAISQSDLAYQTNDIMMGVEYLLKVAKAYRKPISICIGIGSNQGGRDGRGTLSDYLSDIGNARGVCITISAGNEGQAGHHYYGTITSPSTFESVEIKVSKTEGFTLELWGSSPNIFSIAIRSPGGEVIPRIPPRIGESREINLILENTSIQVDYQLVENETGDELIVMVFRDPTEGIWTIDVYEEGLEQSSYHMWLPITNFLSEETFFIKPNPNTTIVTPSASVSPIGVTAYNHYNNSLYIKASRGFARDNLIKPDLAAPGVDVYGPNLRGGYQTRTGSSIAAAHVAGAAALMLEWGITKGNSLNMNSIVVKKYFIRGARRESFLTYPNPEWGFGILDIYQAFTKLLRL